MKKLLSLLLLVMLVLLAGCAGEAPAEIAATTLPVYEFTSALCQGTPLRVTRLVTEEVSCLHDYSLNVRQVKAAESAEVVVISGAGLEEFLDDILVNTQAIDASRGIELICPDEGHHHHEEESQDHSHEGHHHDQDPHIWLSPDNATVMARNICDGLIRQYPQQEDAFRANLSELESRLTELDAYGDRALAELSCRELITFHDGFAYLAQAYGLTILETIEEESGSEASAKELTHLIEVVQHHDLPAIFTEKSGSASAAGVLARETGVSVFSLDMAMSGDSYFDAMYHNIDTLKEALQ